MTGGIDLSTSSVKAVRLAQHKDGIVLAAHAAEPMPEGAFVDGDVADVVAVAKTIASVARKVNISSAYVALPESKSYLFETATTGDTKRQWRISVEQHLDEFVPLPPASASFDIVLAEQGQKNDSWVVGVGFARRVIDELLAVFDAAMVDVVALDAESFAMARATVKPHDSGTSLLVDIGRLTTKIVIVEANIVRFATTIGIGGHAITLSLQKYFGVPESEAKKLNVEKGIAPMLGNEECLEAMLTTVSAIRDEILAHLNYWQSKATPGGRHKPITKVILLGGNGSLRGLAEYLEKSLGVPTATGDVFANFASHEVWVPDILYTEALAFATPIGLALRDYLP